VETSNGFREEYFFLSNFEKSPMKATIRGTEAVFPTGEHLFQAYKLECSNISDIAAVAMVKQFANAPTPSKAKYLGRSVPLDISAWNDASYEYMRKTLQAKFGQHPKLAKKLRDTDGLTLVEYNSWNDRLWGKDEKTREGKNQLGILLMELRSTLVAFDAQLF
jgi:ribA/ribD-fused uncharacterized protein